MISDFEISQLVMSKVFHDLAGPIGAMSNGAEFLKETRSDVHQKAIDLMQLSSSQAVSRLQIFKLVFGYSPQGSEISLNKLKPIIDSYFKATKITFDWKNISRPDEINMTIPAARMLVISTLVATTSLIYGGNVEVEIDTNSEAKITFKLKATCAQGIKIEKDAVQILVERNFDLTLNSQNVLYLYTLRMAENLGGTFKLDYTNDYIATSTTVDNVFSKSDIPVATMSDL